MISTGLWFRQLGPALKLFWSYFTRVGLRHSLGRGWTRNTPKYAPDKYYFLTSYARTYNYYLIPFLNGMRSRVNRPSRTLIQEWCDGASAAFIYSMSITILDSFRTVNLSGIHSFIHCRHWYSASSSGATQIWSAPNPIAAEQCSFNLQATKLFIVTSATKGVGWLPPPLRFSVWFKILYRVI